MIARRIGFNTITGLWLLLLLFDTGGQLSLKLGSHGLEGLAIGPAWFAAAFASGWVWSGLACYSVSFAIWMRILQETPLSIAFPITALVYISVLLASWAALGEAIQPLRWFGVSVIVLGVLILGRDEP